MNSKLLNIGLSALVAGMLVGGLTGCGSDDVAKKIADDIIGDINTTIDPGDSDNADNGDDGYISGVVNNLVDYGCDRTIMGYTTKIGADGKFETDCNTPPFYLKLANDANELTVSQVTSISEGTFSDSDGSGTMSRTTNLDTGVITVVANGESCTETYDVSSLDRTINNAYEVFNFVSFDDELLISNTCPDEDVDDDEDIDDDSDGHMTATLNITITDSTGAESHITSYSSN